MIKSFMGRPNASEDVDSMWNKFCADLEPIKTLLGSQKECHETAEDEKADLEARIEACRRGLQATKDQKTQLDPAIQSLEVIIHILEKANEKSAASIMNSPLTRSRRNRSASQIFIPPALTSGMSVAFRLPRTEGGEWIQCIIVKVTGEGSKQRYEVQDPEPDDDGNAGQVYKTVASNLIYIPPKTASLPTLSPGTAVLARYPETTTFYKAEVIRTLPNGSCKLRFEGEEEAGKETTVERHLVLEYNG
ncbi:SAGA complex subunit Sgf29 [Schizosaccharomyces cryophilus OY26]|uniref:SAGA complex subunit Sgf29 n=1 Tax=Schizosaccharomyces cryophilus (strain OY26 / ATCC MYA-4695 / CBS 11777 / NBRC 106824 / NRRL Y48691) TaxID=653667 RepID=S9VZ19_SCHCR|nr:SAGA complex subunit Sgf29 [Schizosaccharomyces cryophilus OY26]EPY52848.1 SAGA complex subunit Sgf29 [Schizosaccharomyces cryophilus OY26]